MHFQKSLLAILLLSSNTFASSIYHIVPKPSNQCMEVVGGASTDNAPVDQGYCAALPYQNWTLAGLGHNTFQVLSSNGKCLTVNNNSQTAGALVNQSTCAPNQQAQEWLIHYQKDGYVTFEAQNSRLCLSVAPDSSVNGGQLQQQSCDSTNPNQSFFLHNIKSFPAQGNTITVSGSDDVAIQTAINKANAGDTVLIPTGTYKISKPLMLKSGILLLGNSGAILQSAAANEIITTMSTASNIINNVTLEGLTFSGGNIDIQGVNSIPVNPANYGYNIVITDCVFQNIPTTASGVTGLYLNAISNSIIQHNTFQNNGQSIGDVTFLMYDGNGISFLYNTFINVEEGVHIYSQDTSISHDYTFSHNAGTGFQRMGIEYQGHGPNLKITHNTFLNWRPYAWPAGSNLAVGLSIGGIEGGYVVSDNYLDGGAANYTLPNMPVVGIEFVGTRSILENNTITNFTQSFLIGCSAGTIYQGNIISNYAKGAPYNKDGGYCGGERILVNLINGIPVSGWASSLKTTL